MVIEPEYMLWAIEILITHFHILHDLGLNSFKFLFLHGEQKIADKNELFPGLNPSTLTSVRVYNKQIPNPDNEAVQNIIHSGISNSNEDGIPLYKSEELTMPNIVFYLDEDINIKPLVDELIELFPDKYKLSSKLSRYNLRLSNTLGWSIGKNYSKRDLSQINIPLEYQYILTNKKLRQSHKMFPRYVSNHTIINDDNSVNNILSYTSAILPPPYKSLKDVYSAYGLLEYYNNIFKKLGIEPILKSGGKKKTKKKIR